jgi:hypothetical protein
MRTNKILSLAAALLASATLSAQMQGGAVVRASEFALTDMLQFSQYDYSLGTARSAAMGGAFSSLGADMASLSMNPAGLGMYRGSEFSFTPAVSWTVTDAASPGSYSKGLDNKRTRFVPGNIGIALNTFQSTGSLISFTFGFGYTRLADFNYNNSVMLGDLNRSILDVFAKNMTSKGVLLGGLNNNSWYDYDAADWGGVLAYDALGVDPANDMDDNNDIYYAALHGDAITRNSLSVNTRGSAGEYNIAGGMNLENKFYLGFSLGIQSIYYRQNMYYTEEYDQTPYDPDAQNGSPIPMVDYLEYDQYHQYSGAGVNFKVGMIYRPIDPLRLSFTVHTPTFVTLESEYQAWMYTEAQDLNANQADTDLLKSTYNYTSPARVIVGASYQFENVAILSVDYERVWYNGMRLANTENNRVPANVRSGYKADMKYSFKGQDNLRVGLEVRPVPEVALRAGYAYTGSPIKSGVPLAYTGGKPVPATLNAPVANTSNSYSLGLGYRVGGFSIDAAYVLTDIKNTGYNMYWWDESDKEYNIPHGDNAARNSAVNSSMKRNIVTLTAGFRF